VVRLWSSGVWEGVVAMGASCVMCAVYTRFVCNQCKTGGEIMDGYNSIAAGDYTRSTHTMCNGCAAESPLRGCAPPSGMRSSIV